MKIIIGGLVFYLIFVILISLFQRKLLYFPTRESFDLCGPMKNFNIQPITLTHRGENIRYFEYKAPDALLTLVHFHGNAGGACDRYIYYKLLRERFPTNWIFFEYPGYAGDKKSPSQEGILRNAEALLAQLDTQNLVLYGESLGTGVATYLASKFKVKALILQSPYTSIADIGKKHYFYLPVSLLLKDKFEAKVWAQQVNTPVLGLHAKRDQIIPFSIGEGQSKNFKNMNWVPIPNYGHNDIIESSLYWKSVVQFLEGLPSS